MRRFYTTTSVVILSFFLFSSPVFAQSTNSDLLTYTHNTLQILTLVATASAVFFLVKAGYLYITSAGKPETLESAKKTITGALIGLTLVLAANIVTSVFQHSLGSGVGSGGGSAVSVVNINAVEPSDGDLPRS